MIPTGAIFFEGPSLLTGDPIVGVVTGLTGHTVNAKTGPMLQAWLFRPELPPMDAKRQNLDDAVCGDCALRGRDGVDSACYVTPWQGPHNVYKAYRAGSYPVVTGADMRTLVAGWNVRITAYGDPAAVPFEIWQNLLTTAAGWVGYTHQWRRADPRLRWVVMASCDSVNDALVAQAQGWRTFRIRRPREPLVQWTSGLEVVCPASEAGGHRVTCEDCQLCRGRSRPARSIAIVVHGKPGNLAAFRRMSA